MPLFVIRARDSVFESRDEAVDYPHVQDALTAGIDGAIRIVSEEVLGGQTNAAVEICIEDAAGAVAMRSVVALSVSPLLVGAYPAVG